ncbi:MAG: hypothetical protein ACOCTI_01610 [Phycisphaeraceae bacterium]
MTDQLPIALGGAGLLVLAALALKFLPSNRREGPDDVQEDAFQSRA